MVTAILVLLVLLTTVGIILLIVLANPQIVGLRLAALVVCHVGICGVILVLAECLQTL